ncbi:MAG: sugar transferase [Candidatus Sumerlaeaceae bacterium]
MLKEHNYVFKRVNMAIDLVLTAGAVVVAHGLRNAVLAPYFFPEVFREPARFADYAWLAYTMPLFMVAFLRHYGYYQSQRIRSFGSTMGAVIVSAVLTTVAAMVLSFILSQRGSRPALTDVVSGENVSRGVLLLVPVVLTLLMALKTMAVRSFLVGLRKRGKNSRALLLVGSGASLRDFIGLVQGHTFWGFQIKGVVDDSGRESKAVERVPVVAQLAELLPYLERTPVDEVVFIPARRSLEELAPYFAACEEMGIRTRLSLTFFRGTIAKPVLDSFEDVPVVTYSPTTELNAALLFKYTFDRVAAAFLLALASPFLLLISVLIKVASQRWSDPVFYGQERSGLHGKPFTLWKFRSMRLGADQQLSELQEQNEMEGPVFKIKNDPRITAVGRWLRKTSADELPQLWNVFRGDMSLVGPRPPLPGEVAKYDRWQRRRLSMKPGITCLWQVMGRNQLSFDTWMKLDLEYIDRWSLLLDFKILCRTVYVVATGYGAM